MTATRFLALAALILTASPSGAMIVSLAPNADTYIRTGNQNFGSDAFLRLRSTGNHRSLVRFDQNAIAAAVGGGVLQSATLGLFIESNNTSWSTGRPVDVHRLSTAWTEAGATYNCPNDTDTTNGAVDCPVQWDGGSYASTPTASYLQTNELVGAIDLDVTSDVVAFLGGTPNQGWLVKKRDENLNGLVDFTSREGTTTQAPRLVLDIFIPPTNTPTNTPTVTPTATPSSTATPTPTPDPNCGPQPLVGCRQSVQAGKSLLLIKDKGGASDGLLFKWIKGEQTDISAFGNPTADTDYSFCIYDQTAGQSSLVARAEIPPAGSCGGKPCWKATSKGFRYKDSLLLQDGIKVITLKSGGDGTAKIILKGKGSNLDLPSLPLDQDQQVIAQIKNDTGACWEARFSGPAKKNDSDRFKDGADTAIVFPPSPTPTMTQAVTPTVTSTQLPTSTPGGPTATPTATQTPGIENCGNGFLESGEFYDDSDVGLLGDLDGSECPADAQVLPCTVLGSVSVRVDLIPAVATQPTAATILVGYKSDLASLPAAKGTSTIARVTWPPPLPFIRNATDFNYALRAVTVRTDGPIDTDQPMFTINFDACSGQPLPDPATEFGCIVEGCSGQGGPIEGCTCVTSAP